MSLQSTWVVNKPSLFLPVALESLQVFKSIKSLCGYPSSAPHWVWSALPGSLSLWKSLQTLGKAPRISNGALEGLSGVQEGIRSWILGKCHFIAQISAPQKVTSMHMLIVLFSEHKSFLELLEFLCSCCHQAFLWILNCELFGLYLTVFVCGTDTVPAQLLFVCINVTNRTQVTPQQNQSRFCWWLLGAFSCCSLQLFHSFISNDSEVWVFFFSSSWRCAMEWTIWALKYFIF